MKRKLTVLLSMLLLLLVAFSGCSKTINLIPFNLTVHEFEECLPNEIEFTNMGSFSFGDDIKTDKEFFSYSYFEKGEEAIGVVADSDGELYDVVIHERYYENNKTVFADIVYILDPNCKREEFHTEIEKIDAEIQRYHDNEIQDFDSDYYFGNLKCSVSGHIGYSLLLNRVTTVSEDK